MTNERTALADMTYLASILTKATRGELRIDQSTADDLHGRLDYIITHYKQ